MRHLWSDYTNISQVIVFVIDACDTNRVDEVRSELHDLILSVCVAPISSSGMMEKEGEDDDTFIVTKPIVVLFNKMDMPVNSI